MTKIPEAFQYALGAAILFGVPTTLAAAAIELRKDPVLCDGAMLVVAGAIACWAINHVRSGGFGGR